MRDIEFPANRETTPCAERQRLLAPSTRLITVATDPTYFPPASGEVISRSAIEVLLNCSGAHLRDVPHRLRTMSPALCGGIGPYSSPSSQLVYSIGVEYTPSRPDWAHRFSSRVERPRGWRVQYARIGRQPMRENRVYLREKQGNGTRACRSNHLVGAVGVEPTRPRSADFKSAAYASSATPP